MATDKLHLTEDITGRDRLGWNVMTSWAGHLVYLVAGFVMPRLIDQRLGQTELGLWDFGWTMVSYLGLAGIGIGSSVNRYVARYRAVNDVDGLRGAVSSVAVVQCAAAGVVVLVTVVATVLLSTMFSERLGADLDAARWVVGLLGLGVAVQLAFDYFRGVITGCHRWDLHNAINSGCYAATVIAMVLVLRADGGLRSLAAVNLCGVIGAEAVRAVVAFRVCPELRVHLAYVTWPRIREMTSFGAKSLTNDVARLVLLQANSLMVAGHLGVAALAVYSRPLALMRHVETLTGKFAFVLAPTSSSLQQNGANDEQLRRLLIDGTQYAAYFALPMMLGLSLLGEPILYLWMGEGYAHGLVMTLLAAGSILPVTQQPGVQILTGLNRHGPLSIASLITAIGGVLLGALVIGRFGWGLPGAALAVGLAMTIGNGLFVAVCACRTLQIPLGRYFVRAYFAPIACTAPFAVCLLMSRWLFASEPVTAVLVGVSVGGGVLAATYWRHVIPELRARLGQLQPSSAPALERRRA